MIDLERFLTSGQATRLDKQLAKLEADTGVKLRVLCQAYPNTPGLAIKDYWKLDDQSIVLVADKGNRGASNLLVIAPARHDPLTPVRTTRACINHSRVARARSRQNFNVGEGLKGALPNVFWTRLQSALGNKFYVKENGEDQAITRAVDAIDECLRAGYCVDVPKALDAGSEPTTALESSLDALGKGLGGKISGAAEKIFGP